MKVYHFSLLLIFHVVEFANDPFRSNSAYEEVGNDARHAGRAYFGAQIMMEGDVNMPVARLVMVIKTPKKQKEQKTYITFCIVCSDVSTPLSD